MTRPTTRPSRPGTPRTWVTLGASAVALATLAACGSTETAAVVIPVFDLQYDPTAAIDEPDPARTGVMPADLLRNQLEKELTWHGVTLTQVMRHAHAGDPALSAWIAELNANTDDLTAAIGLLYGPEEARAFRQQWAQHTQFLADYAVAIAADDDGAADLARERLAIYAADSGSFFATVTNRALPADAVRTLLDTHVAHMIDMIEAVDRGDEEAALAASIEDNAYLAEIGNGLVKAMLSGDLSDDFPGSVETEIAYTCSIVLTETGNYLLRELSPERDSAAAAEAFQQATGTPLVEVIGVIDQLQAADPVLVAQTADLALDRAFEHARPPAP